jgi:hypothetical protein
MDALQASANPCSLLPACGPYPKGPFKKIFDALTTNQLFWLYEANFVNSYMLVLQ